MKVLFTIDSLQQGGAEQSIANIIRYFSKDVEVTVLFFYPKADLLPLYQTLGCNVISLNLPGKYNWIKGIKALKSIIKLQHPDVVVSSLYRSNIISRLACKMTQTPLVGTFVDDSYSKERKKTFRGLGILKYHLTWLLDRMTSSIPQLWISNSNYIGLHNATQLGIPPSKIKVVYRGRDFDAFKAWQKPVSDKFIFICIGRLYEKKGYPELIAAFASLNPRAHGIALHIYGEGDYRIQIENSIKALGLENEIRLFGNVPDASKQLYAAHCFVFPSRFEGFSGALVEAMMTGIPIISSDIPMNVEAVADNQTALVHRMKDVFHLSEKMQWMMDHYDQMIAMGSRARKVAQEQFDIKKIARQYQAVLESVTSTI